MHRNAPIYRVDTSRDGPSRPYSCLHQVPFEIEASIIELRRRDRLGPARIGYRLALLAAHRVLVRHE